MSQSYQLLSGFRLVEFSSVVLITVLLYVVSLPIYQTYIINAYALNQAFVLFDVRTRLSIDSAYTGNVNGTGDYSYITDDTRYVEDIDVSSQGHVAIIATLTHEDDDVPLFVESQINKKKMVFHRNVNTQGGYSFVSWHCQKNQNDPPFMVIDPVPDATFPSSFDSFFCKR